MPDIMDALPTPRFGLRGRLLLLLLAIMIPIFGYMAYDTVRQRAHQGEQAKGEVLRLTRFVALQHEEFVISARVFLSLVARSANQLGADPAECRRMYASQLAGQPMYVNVGELGADGRLRCGAGPQATNTDYSAQSFFQRAVETRAFAIGDFYVDPTLRQGILYFAYPALKADGTLTSVYFVALSLRWLGELVADIELPPGSAVSVIDSRGTVLARAPNPEGFVGRMVEGPIIRLIRENPAGGLAEAAGYDGIPRVFAFAPLYRQVDSGALYASVAAGIPSAEVYREVNERFAGALLFLTAIFLLGWVGSWVLTDLLLLRRIRRLAQSARRFGAGERSVRSALPYRNDELGDLSNTFDQMAGAIERQLAEIDRSSREVLRTNRALRVLSAVNRALALSTDKSTLANEICRIFVSLGGYGVAWVGLAEHDDRKSITPNTQAGLEEAEWFALLRRGTLSWADGAADDSPAGRAIRFREPVVVKDIFADSQLAHWHELALRHEYAALVALPVVAREQVIGVLEILSRDPESFDDDETRLLVEAAADLGYGLESLTYERLYRQADEEIKHIAFHDALTGLPNQAQFEMDLQSAIREAALQQQPVAVLQLGIRRVGQINDVLGFAKGDELVRNIGRRLKDAVGQRGKVARLHGDKFVIMLPGSDAADAGRIARQIGRVLEERLLLDGIQLRVENVIGIAVYPEHGLVPELLMRRADRAMREARQIGRPYALYESRFDHDSRRHLTLVARLQQAIEKREFDVFYQPKLMLASNCITGVEVLSRWRQSDATSTMEYISVAENAGLITALTELTLQQVLRDAKQLRAERFDITFAVNLSTRGLADRRFIDSLLDRVVRSGVDPHRLQLEITESALLEEPRKARETLLAVRDAGFSIHLDNFGTGYSSLGDLKNLPVSAIKIDKSFVTEMERDQGALAIVKSVISLAHDLGMQVIAEGVETREAYQRIRDLGGDMVQGYFIASPQPLEKFRGWLAGMQICVPGGGQGQAVG